jgi:hypothetical protein
VMMGMESQKPMESFRLSFWNCVIVTCLTAHVPMPGPYVSKFASFCQTVPIRERWLFFNFLGTEYVNFSRRIDSLEKRDYILL